MERSSVCPDFSALGGAGAEHRVHRDPANAGRRFIPLLLGDCDLPVTLRRYKVVDFREESDAAFAEVLATGQTEAVAMKRRTRDTPPPKLLSGELNVAQSNSNSLVLA